MKKSKDFMKCIAYIATLFAFVVSVYLMYIVVINLSSYQQAEEAFLNQMKGSFGDLIAGTVGICLSFASTLFLFVTFREQRKQFEESKFDTNKERFESTFFNLLSMFYQVRETVNKDISICTDGQMKSIKEFFDGLKNKYLQQNDSEEGREIASYLNKKSINSVELERINEYLGYLYESYISEKKCNIGYYYRYVFNMINFVIEQWGDSKADICKYLNFIQAQMSNEELALIFYDVISHYGLDKNYNYKFKDKIDEYGFLENIDSTILLDRSHHIVFSKTRFKFLNRDEKNKKN